MTGASSPAAPAGHTGWALLAAGIGLAASAVTGGLGLAPAAIGTAALLIGLGRGRGWALSRRLQKPRLFSVASALYLPVFFVDLLSTYTVEPLGALSRLVVLLLVSEVLAGDPAKTHRPVLFGLLLIMAAAAQTTDLWFALPLAAFTIAAAAAQMRFSLMAASPLPRRRGRDASGPARRGTAASGGGAGPGPRLRGVAPMAAGALLLGTAFFAAIPRVGTGWGVRPAGASELAGLESGLSDSVELGLVGRIKRRASVAFRVRVESGPYEAATAYWKARTYVTWTGSGWTGADSGLGEVHRIPGGETVHLAMSRGEALRPLVVEVERVRTAPLAMITPGRPLWLSSERDAIVVHAEDGTLRGLRGAAPRRYRVSADAETVPGAGRGPALSPPDGLDTIEACLDTDRVETGVEEWARGLAAPGARPEEIARALVADLSRRPYSLDTARIDPERPLVSFLAGAPAHCEYFASAMALGLRLHGVPSRVAAGYLGSDPLVFGRAHAVRDASAHLWVEAHLPGRGWTRFDPTPAAGRGPDPSGWSAARAGWEGAVLLWDTWIVGLDLGDQVEVFLSARDAAGAILAGLADGGRGAVALGGAAAVALAALLALARRRLRRAGGVAAPAMPRTYRRLLALARRRGLALGPSETAGEFALRAARRLGDPAAVALISGLYERERFGGRPATSAEILRAEEALRALQAAARISR